MKANKSTLIILVVILAALLLSSCKGVTLFSPVTLEEFVATNTDQRVVKAKVVEVISAGVEVNDYFGTEQVIETIEFTARIIDSNISDKEISCRQIIDSTNSYMTKTISEGDTVYLYPSLENGAVIGDFVEYARVPYIIAFGILFALVLLVFSGFKGLRSLVALIITCAVIFFVFIPLLLDGYNIMLLAILTSVIVTVITLLIVCGFRIKAASAIIGATMGFLIAGLLAFIMQKLMSMTGLTDTFANVLYYHHKLDMNGLMFAAIIIGALGATMDVAVSIASSLEEIVEHRKGDITSKEILKSGMKIGGDIMGTMTNTLILAYVGSSLPIIVLVYVNSTQIQYTLSWELFSSEFLRAIAGSIGLVCTVPMTALVTSLLHLKKKQKTAVVEAIETVEEE
ncbi:MAG: YibE/F family protein [Clostridia bacterium]|nr:YibE/F family protein [Clostridia bacterium]